MKTFSKMLVLLPLKRYDGVVAQNIVLNCFKMEQSTIKWQLR